MHRDLEAEWARIEADYRDAWTALDAIRKRAGPTIRGKSSNISAPDLSAYRQVHERFRQVKARRAAFLVERKKRARDETKPV